MVKAIKAAQLADQIRDYVAGWALQDFPGAFFSLTDVTLSPDLREATIWVSLLDPSQTGIIAKLNQRAGDYRHKFAQQYRGRSVPGFHFVFDNRATFDQKLDELLNG